MCLGQWFNSTWAIFTTAPLPIPDPNSAFYQNYIANFALALQGTVGLNNSIPLPQVRVCSERSQRLNAFRRGAAIILSNCAPIVGTGNAGNNNTYEWVIYVEFVNPGGSSTALADQAVSSAQAPNSLLATNFAVTKATTIGNPFDIPFRIPYENGWLLGVMIGIATGLFLISVGACALFYFLKSFREAGAMPFGTDSTASMQEANSSSGKASSASGASHVEDV